MKMNQTKKNKKTNMLLACFMLFVFPIIAVFIGAFLGQYIANFLRVPTQMFQVLGGIIAFVLAFVLIKLFDKSAVTDDEEEKIEWDDL
jgi:small neutral amino acid transporter SnatA (MarC family)